MKKTDKWARPLICLFHLNISAIIRVFIIAVISSLHICALIVPLFFIYAPRYSYNIHAYTPAFYLVFWFCYLRFLVLLVLLYPSTTLFVFIFPAIFMGIYHITFRPFLCLDKSGRFHPDILIWLIVWTLLTIAVLLFHTPRILVLFLVSLSCFLAIRIVPSI